MTRALLLSQHWFNIRHGSRPCLDSRALTASQHRTAYSTGSHRNTSTQGGCMHVVVMQGACMMLSVPTAPTHKHHTMLFSNSSTPV